MKISGQRGSSVTRRGRGGLSRQKDSASGLSFLRVRPAPRSLSLRILGRSIADIPALPPSCTARSRLPRLQNLLDPPCERVTTHDTRKTIQASGGIHLADPRNTRERGLTLRNAWNAGSTFSSASSTRKHPTIVRGSAVNRHGAEPTPTITRGLAGVTGTVVVLSAVAMYLSGTPKPRNAPAPAPRSRMFSNIASSWSKSSGVLSFLEKTCITRMESATTIVLRT